MVVPVPGAHAPIEATRYRIQRDRDQQVVL
jgi:hypothetical protein